MSSESRVDLVKFQAATDPNVVIIPVAYYIFLLAGFVAGSAMIAFLRAVLNPTSSLVT